MKILTNKQYQEIDDQIRELEHEVHLKAKENRTVQGIAGELNLKIQLLEESLHQEKENSIKQEQLIQKLEERFERVKGKLGGMTQGKNKNLRKISELEEQNKILIKQNSQCEILIAENEKLRKVIKMNAKEMQDLKGKITNYKEEFKRLHVPKTVSQYEKRLKPLKTK